MAKPRNQVADDRSRCDWALAGDDDYCAYHDREWGVPVHEDRRHFEFLILEGAQAGLSWATILRKRDGYRRAFAGFDPVKVARFTERRIQGYDSTQPMKRPNAAPVHDALAVASIVEPSVITTEFLHVDVETHGTLTVGETVVDTNHRGGGEPNVHYAFGADEPRFVEILLETFARPAGAARP